MSLTSRVFDLFSTAGTPDSTTISHSSSSNSKLYNESDLRDASRQARAEDLMDEEEPRPPYAHVRLIPHIAMGVEQS